MNIIIKIDNGKNDKDWFEILKKKNELISNAINVVFIFHKKNRHIAKRHSKVLAIIAEAAAKELKKQPVGVTFVRGMRAKSANIKNGATPNTFNGTIDGKATVSSIILFD